MSMMNDAKQIGNKILWSLLSVLRR